MTSAPVLPHPASAVASQATVIEQSRAVAEVHAAVMIAQARPRDEERAIAAMRRACARPTLAADAFYEFPRGRETVTGATVYLARELARIWGNIDYKVVELQRDASGSEMLAVAWDLETNARASTTWINPPRRYTGGDGVLSSLRDVYENNANTGARRVREQIFAVLPYWFVEDAQEACRATNAAVAKADSGLADRAVAAFAAMGVVLGQLEEKVGRLRADWTPEDLASLGVTMTSIKKGTLKKDEAFPPKVVDVTTLSSAPTPAADEPAPETPAEVPSSAGPATTGHGGGGEAAPAPAAPDAGPVPPDQPPAANPAVPDETPASAGEAVSSGPPDGDRPAAATQKKRIGVLATQAKLDDAGRLALVSALAGRLIATTDHLGMREAAGIVETLELAAKGDDFAGWVDDILGGTSTPSDETLAVGSRPWHEAGHPTSGDDGHVTTVPQLLNGDCGFCEDDGGPE